VPYLYDAHRGGVMISDAIGRRTEERVREFAHARFEGRFRELGVWFRGQFCYLDLYRDPGPYLAGWAAAADESDESREQYRDRLAATPVHLLRLRYFGNPDRWSFAVYDYAIEDYEPATFPSGEAAGPPEEALEWVLRAHLD
jgi:hypothetical protein